MAISFRQGFWEIDGAIRPLDFKPSISDGIQQSLDRLMGFDYDANIWRFVRVDGNGLLYTSASAAAPTAAVQSTGAVIASASLLVAANTLRKRVIIQNTGAYAFTIGYNITMLFGDGVALYPGDIWIEDKWLGAMYGYMLVGATTTFSASELS